MMASARKPVERSRARVAAMAVAMVLVLVGCVVDLGTLGGETSQAFDINNAGLVVGTSQIASGEHRAFKRPSGSGALTDLGTLGADTESAAHAVNDAGIIVGSSRNPGIDAVRWDATGAITSLGNLGGAAQAWAINASGVIVGGSKDVTGSFDQAFVWDPGVGTMTALPALAGATDSVAYGVNDSGVIVGSATVAGETHAVRWASAVATPIDLSSATGPSVAYAINGVGTIVGQATFDVGGTPTAHAAVWEIGTVVPRDLGAIVPGPSIARDVNAEGVIGGSSGDPAGNVVPVLWDPNEYRPSIIPTLSGGSDSTVTAVNNNTVPVGNTTVNGFEHAVLYDKANIATYPLIMPIGHAKNFLGTGNQISAYSGFTAAQEASNRENRWLAISGKCASKEQGERFMTVSDANFSSGSYVGCTGGVTIANGEHDPNGYFYAIDLDVDRVGPLYVEVFDPAICAPAGSFAIDSPIASGGTGFPIAYTVRGPDTTPSNSLDNPILSEWLADPVTNCPAGAASFQATWRTMHVLNDPTAGRYLLQVSDANESFDRNRGTNGFSIRARINGPVTAIGAVGPAVWGLCSAVPGSTEPPFDASCPQVRATANAGLYNSAPGTTASFPVTDVASRYSGRTLNIQMWDTGEGGSTVQVLNPLGAPVSFTWEVDCSGGEIPPAGGCAGASATTALSVAGTGPQPGPNRLSTSKYNDRLLTLTVALPPDMASAYGGATQWRIRYNSTGSVTDRTTWSAHLTP